MSLPNMKPELNTDEIMDYQKRPSRPKRQKYMSRWETSLYETSRDTPSVPLQQLFDSKEWIESRTRTKKTRSSTTTVSSSSCCRSSPPRVKRQSGDAITFRLEHREGGALATHQGEERILLFRSDQKGAIAKIIFSSTPTPTKDKDIEEADDVESVAQAKIHVLDVKDPHRGNDIGGLLVWEAILALKQRYLSGDQPTSKSALPSVRCELDAEEDVRRHNKLIAFYERFGFSVKPKIRPQFLNNNDGETYRKVPMQIDLKASNHIILKKERQSLQTGSLVGSIVGFLPIIFRGGGGGGGAESKQGKLSSDNPDNRRVCWLMTDDGHGHIQFRTTKGGWLTVDPQGRCLEEDSITSASGHLSIFQLLRVSDATQLILSGDGEEEKDTLDWPSTENELWVLWSPHGTFLNLNRVSQNLEASKHPSFWQANSHSQTLSLTCVEDTPTRRQHYRQGWIRQTLEYVLAAKARYLSFKLARLPLQKALHLVKGCPAFPFRLDPASRGLSVRTLCFRTAEAARAAGHPDWIQFVALIHALGSVVNGMDIKTAIQSEDEYDWTIPCISRVVGCASSVDSTFAEFSHLNTDEKNEKYSSPLGMYRSHVGLDNVHLTWSGPEYLYHMLRYNDIDLPDVGLAVLRLFPLYDWHSKKLYDGLANEDDKEILPFVRDFDQLRREAIDGCSAVDELADADCDRLWCSHYERLVGKFGADRVLDW